MDENSDSSLARKRKCFIKENTITDDLSSFTYSA
jgi:hypothetical protein